MEIVNIDITGQCMQRVPVLKANDPKRKVKVFQEGNDSLLTVSVTQAVYDKAEVGKPIVIKNVRLGEYEALNDMTGRIEKRHFLKQQF